MNDAVRLAITHSNTFMLRLMRDTAEDEYVKELINAELERRETAKLKVM